MSDDLHHLPLQSTYGLLDCVHFIGVKFLFSFNGCRFPKDLKCFLYNSLNSRYILNVGHV